MAKKNIRGHFARQQQTAKRDGRPQHNINQSNVMPPRNGQSNTASASTFLMRPAPRGDGDGDVAWTSVRRPIDNHSAASFLPPSSVVTGNPQPQMNWRQQRQHRDQQRVWQERQDATRMIATSGGGEARVSAASSFIDAPISQWAVVDDSRFAAPPPEGLNLLSMIFVLPGPEHGYGFDLKSPVGAKALERLARRHKVWIQPLERNATHIEVSAEASESMAAALAAVRELLEREELDPGGIALANPSSVTLGSDQTGSTSGDGGLAKPIILRERNGRFRGLADGIDQPMPAKTNYKRLATAFGTAFSRLATGMVQTPNEMKLTASLGCYRLTQKPNQNRATFALAEFDALLKEVTARNTGIFEVNLGDDRFAQQLRELITQTPETFEPRSGAVLDLQSVKPTFNFAVFIAGMRIEVDVNCEGDVPRASDVCRVFRVNSAIKQEIVLACPETCFDWRLQSLVEPDASSIPPAVARFVRDLRFGKPTPGAFPTPNFDPAYAKSLGVTSVAGKVSWMYSIAGTQWLTDVVVYHNWPNAMIDNTPVVGCGLNLTHREWPYVLRAQDTSSTEREFGDDFAALFPREGDKSGIEDFLERVDLLQGLACRAFSMA